MPKGLNISPHAVPLRRSDEGVFVVGESRVSLDSVIAAFLAGASAEDIVSQFPSLDLADVYAVLAFYLRERTSVDAYLKRRRDEIDAIQEECEARPGTQALRQRLLARRS